LMIKRVLEIKAGSRSGNVDIVFDDGTSLSTVKSFAKKSALSPGKDVDLGELTRSADEDEFNRCYEAALNYLEYRPRSEGELRNHLVFKRRFSAGCVSQAMSRLKKTGLLNDRAFAESWIRDRIANKPKGRRMIRQELLRKGVKAEVINEFLADVNDEDSALKAGLKKSRTLAALEHPEFTRRLTAYLARRGYSSEVVNAAVARLWDKVSR